MKQKLNTTIVYVLSLVGFVCCCIWGAGVIPSAIAYYIANNKHKEASINPELYENPNAMKTAKTIALVVLIINVLVIIYMIYQISTVGWDEMMEESRMRMEEWGVEQ